MTRTSLASGRQKAILTTTAAVQPSRALGAVLGSAVGDALGAPFEFGPPGAISDLHPEPRPEGRVEMLGGGPFGWAPGEFTDDTQMALVQAESLLARGRVDEEDLFARFQAWSTGAPDIRRQTAAVLRGGRSWRSAARHHDLTRPRASAGNGGLMRATPSAVWFAAAPLEECLLAGRRLDAVTHGDPATQWGAALYQALLREALRGDDPWSALPGLLERLPPRQSRYRDLLDPAWHPRAGDLGNGTVWVCLAQAVWSVRRAACFAEALENAIDLGGDTDTVAAVTGGLAGALHGESSIPARWTAVLHGTVTGLDGSRRTYRVRDLREITARLMTEGPAS
jgi:ADP-ribosyl-[dinitrogen reductase] hydrolase